MTLGARGTTFQTFYHLYENRTIVAVSTTGIKVKTDVSSNHSFLLGELGELGESALSFLIC